MNTKTIEELFLRKSVRVFRDEPITKEQKTLILEATCQAPTAGNQQLYTILDITDQKLKDALAITCDNQPFIAKAKMVLIFCADCKKWYDLFAYNDCEPRTPGVGDLLLAVSDTNIAAQNAVTAAHSLGIGTCYIGDIMENAEKHQELLNLPKYVFPCAMVVFGWPTEQQLHREKPQRCKLEHIVHENGYRAMDKDELNEMFAKNAIGKPFPEWCKAFCNRKYNSDFSREMTRSVGEYIKQFL